MRTVSILLFIIIVVFLVALLTFIVWLRSNMHRVVDVTTSAPTAPLGALAHELRTDCDSEVLYCFADADCQHGCRATDEFACINGTCTNRRWLATSDAIVDECLAEMGMMSFIVGNTTFGRYENHCQSIDPGIAISSTENRMCYNQTKLPLPEFNYLRQMPTTSECQCNEHEYAVVPATPMKRQHVECSPLADMLRVSAALAAPSFTPLSAATTPNRHGAEK